MKIKAYAWDDEDYGGSYFVWTTTPGKAKALLASEHDREFTEMRVYRVPWADKYSESKIIPAKELLSNGWWLYCSNCGTRVQNDTATVLDEVEVLCDECAKELAWSAVKGRYINSSVSNKKVNSAAIVECKGFKVRERQI